MELVLINPNSAEWNYMWKWLEDHPINEGLTNPSIALNNGEGWMYMGTYQQDNRIIHTFRHKDHPKTRTVKTLNVSGSSGFTLDQIAKKFRL